MAKTWKEKYHNGKKPEVKRLDADFVDLKAGTKMLISTPAEVEEYVRSIPYGETRTIKDIRTVLAKKHKAAGTCPITTGIFLRIASEVALEELIAGKELSEIMPFWRAVDPKGNLAKKLNGGPALIIKLREEELK